MRAKALLRGGPVVVREVEEFLRPRQLRLDLLPLAVLRHHLAHAAVLLVELRVVRGVGVDLGLRQLLRQGLVARFDLFEFV